MKNQTAVWSLNIETSTTLCSVSIGRNEVCVDCLEINDGQYHSEKLHLFIKDLMKRHTLSFSQIDVIAVSSGPGSYTGLRIGATTAKTLAYALNIPLVTVSSLHTQALHYIQVYQSSVEYIFSTMKARGNKIYLALYSKDGQEIISPQVFVVSESSVQQIRSLYSNSVFVGSAAGLIDEKYLALENILPSARFLPTEVMRKYLHQEFSDIAYFEPMYM